MAAALLIAALLAGGVGLVGVAAGIAVALRAQRSMRGIGSPGLESGLTRLRATVATGVEQSVIGTVRSLGIPQGPADVAYGALYFESDADRRILVRSRSMLDRGLLAVLTFTPEARRTVVAYSIVRLPNDEGVHASVLEFEVTLVQAVRRLDPVAEVHLSSSALRGVERSTSRGRWPGLTPGP